MSLQSGQWAEALPRLTQDADLQKLLAEEKMRSEAHRTNYQTLKAEHTRLQNEYIEVQSEMKATVEETKLMQEKYQNLLSQAKRDHAAKQAECNALREQSLNPQKLDLLRIQVTEDVESKFRGKFEQLGEECDKYRSEYNKLKYEYSFLKAEYEHEKTEHLRVMEETKLRHEAEVTNLRKERETLLVRSQHDPNSDTQRLRTIQRENAQLHLKVKGLLSELEEIRAQREHFGLQSDSVSRLHSKQLAEHAANIKALETEKGTLKMQYESLQKELTNSGELQTQFTSRIHELEKDNIMLKNKAEETVHKSKVELTTLKMDMLKERGDLERQRDQLQNTVDDLRCQIDITKHTIEKQESLVAEKERDCVRRVQSAREEEWSKLHSIESEKIELESKLQEIQRRKIDEEARLHADKEKMEERVTSAKELRETAEKEALVLKTKLSHMESLGRQLEHERSDNSELKNRLHKIESTYQSYVSSEHELQDMNIRLKNEVDVLKEDIRSAKDEIMRGKNETEKVLAQQKSGWTEQKLHQQHRLDELETQLAESQRQLGQVLESNKKRKKKISKIVSQLKNKLQVYSAKIEELKIERDTYKRYIRPEQHVQLKKKMNDLIRKHREFRTIILSEKYNPKSCGNCKIAIPEDKNSVVEKLKGAMKEVPIGDYSFTSADYQVQTSAFVDLANHHEKELMSIKERLDMLDTNQTKQMEELKGISPVVTPRGYKGADAELTESEDGQDLYSEDGLDTEPMREGLSVS